MSSAANMILSFSFFLFKDHHRGHEPRIGESARRGCESHLYPRSTSCFLTHAFLSALGIKSFRK